jgi:carbohydrate diacid regulator
MMTMTSGARPVLTREQIRFTPVLATRFERIAGAIVERVAELLCAPIAVVDENDVAVASTDPGAIGSVIVLTDENDGQSGLYIPLRLDGQRGAVIVGEPLNDEVISPRLAQALVSLVINQTLALEQSPNRHQRKNSFIRDLLHGTIDDEAAILREANLLGMDLATPRSVILIDAAAYILTPPTHSGTSQAKGAETADSLIRRRAQLVIGSVVGFFHLPNDTICAYIGDGVVAVLKASNTRNLVSWADAHDPADPVNSSWTNLAALKRAGAALLKHLEHDTGVAVHIGIGRYHPRMSGIARSYQDACAALSLGRRFHSQERVHCLDSLGTVAFVGIPDERTKIELAAHLLSPLDQEPELIETLHAFFANNCCPSTTARELSIHRNTLNYRLQKIASLAGLDPRRFNEAAQIHLALLLRSFRVEAS